eukprot:8879069-Pyramimonas_sp.AAC.1
MQNLAPWAEGRAMCSRLLEKASYSGLLRVPPMTMEPGLCTGRRLEGVILVAQLLEWRLKRAWHSFAFTHKDMSNAFARGAREELEQTVELHAEPQNVDLRVQRFRCSVIRLERLEGG